MNTANTSKIDSKNRLLSWLKPALTIVLIVVSAAMIRTNWFSNANDADSVPKIYGPGLAAASSGITFIDQNGQSFNTTSMGNKIWLVNFFFTSCGGPCPFMTSQIKGVLEREKNLYALSISTDPDVDTPPILKLYGEKFKADPSRWFMVRTDAPTLMKFGQEILKLPIGEKPDAHSTRIVLLDGQGKIRAWYDSQDPGIRKTILRDIAALR